MDTMVGAVLGTIAIAAVLGCAWLVSSVFQKVAGTPWIAAMVITVQSAIIGSLLWTREGAEHAADVVGTHVEVFEENAEEERQSAARVLAAFGLTRDEPSP